MFPICVIYRLRMLAVVVLVPLVGTVLPSSGLPAVPIASASGFTPPQSLVLHAHDLPSAFGGDFRENGASISNAEVAAVEHVTTGTIDRHERLGGYSTSLTKQKSKGGIFITDSVGAYGSASGAHWQYEKFLSVFPVPPRSTTISMRGIGNEARAYLQSSVYGKLTVASVGVYFRRGHYDARIDITAFARLRPADVQALTRVLDGRLSKAR